MIAGAEPADCCHAPAKTRTPGRGRQDRRRHSLAHPAAVPRPAFEVADIFLTTGRRAVSAKRRARQPRPAEGDVGIESLPHVALGGHVARCENGAQNCQILAPPKTAAKKPHCPQVSGRRRQGWLAESRGRKRLPIGILPPVFTMPGSIAAISYQTTPDLWSAVHAAAEPP